MLCWYSVVHERYGNWEIRELLVVAGLGNRRCLSEYERTRQSPRTGLASSPDIVLISVSGQGPDDLISTTSGGSASCGCLMGQICI